MQPGRNDGAIRRDGRDKSRGPLYPCHWIEFQPFHHSSLNPNLELAPAKSPDRSVLSGRYRSCLESIVIVERGLGGIVKRAGDDASVQTHGSSRGIVSCFRCVDDPGVRHASDPDQIGPRVNNLEIGCDPAERRFRGAAGNFSVYIRVGGDASAARVEPGEAGTPEHAGGRGIPGFAGTTRSALSGEIEYHGPGIDDDLAVPQEIQAVHVVGSGGDMDNVGGVNLQISVLAGRESIDIRGRGPSAVDESGGAIGRAARD